MKLVHRDGERIEFRLNAREHRVLLELLRLYPAVPIDFGVRAKGTGAHVEQRDLLQTELSDHQREVKAELERFVAENGAFEKRGDEYALRLSPLRAEWLLQVINDIRVGSWLQVGCPDQLERNRLAAEHSGGPMFWAMEVCGYLQMLLLEALDGGGNDAEDPAAGD